MEGNNTLEKVFNEEKRKINLIEAGQARGIDQCDIILAIQKDGQKLVMESLRSLGFSLQEIGDFFGKTRQWASLNLPGGKNALTPPLNRASPDVLASMIWRMAMDDLDWWGNRERLKHDKVVDFFRDNYYTWREARQLASRYSISKLHVILRVRFYIDPFSDDEVKAWFGKRINILAKYDILYMINEGQALQVSRRLFDRIWSELGLRSPIKGNYS